jgi:hypothetical protein
MPRFLPSGTGAVGKKETVADHQTWELELGGPHAHLQRGGHPKSNPLIFFLFKTKGFLLNSP